MPNVGQNNLMNRFRHRPTLGLLCYWMPFYYSWRRHPLLSDNALGRWLSWPRTRQEVVPYPHPLPTSTLCLIYQPCCAVGTDGRRIAQTDPTDDIHPSFSKRERRRSNSIHTRTPLRTIVLPVMNEEGALESPNRQYWHSELTPLVLSHACVRSWLLYTDERTNQFKWQLSCNEGITDELYIWQWYPVNIEWLPSAFQSRDLHDYGCLYWNVRNNGTIQQFQQRKTSRNINTLVGFGVTILVQSSSITTSTFGVIRFHPIGTNVPYYVSLSSIVISYCLFVSLFDVLMMMMVCTCAERRERENKSLLQLYWDIHTKDGFQWFNSDFDEFVPCSMQSKSILLRIIIHL